MKKAICCALMVLHLGACTTLSTTPHGNGGVRVGDRVVVADPNGGRQVVATSVNESEICAKDECFSADRIVQVQHEEIDALKTVGLVLAVAFLALLIGASRGSFGYAGFPPGT